VSRFIIQEAICCDVLKVQEDAISLYFSHTFHQLCHTSFTFSLTVVVPDSVNSGRILNQLIGTSFSQAWVLCGVNIIFKIIKEVIIKIFVKIFGKIF
jgi:hypothetical protein